MLPHLTEHDLLGAHGGEEIAHRECEAFTDEGVQDAVGIAPFRDEACLTKHAEVTGNGRSRGVEASRDLTGREFPVFQVLEDLPPSRVRKGSKDV